MPRTSNTHTGFYVCPHKCVHKKDNYPGCLIYRMHPFLEHVRNKSVHGHCNKDRPGHPFMVGSVGRPSKKDRGTQYHMHKQISLLSTNSDLFLAWAPWVTQGITDKEYLETLGRELGRNLSLDPLPVPERLPEPMEFSAEAERRKHVHDHQATSCTLKPHTPSSERFSTNGICHGNASSENAADGHRRQTPTLRIVFVVPECSIDSYTDSRLGDPFISRMANNDVSPVSHGETMWISSDSVERSDLEGVLKELEHSDKMELHEIVVLARIAALQNHRVSFCLEWVFLQHILNRPELEVGIKDHHLYKERRACLLQADLVVAHGSLNLCYDIGRPSSRLTPSMIDLFIHQSTLMSSAGSAVVWPNPSSLFQLGMAADFLSRSQTALIKMSKKQTTQRPLPFYGPYPLGGQVKAFYDQCQILNSIPRPFSVQREWRSGHNDEYGFGSTFYDTMKKKLVSWRLEAQNRWPKNREPAYFVTPVNPNVNEKGMIRSVLAKGRVVGLFAFQCETWTVVDSVTPLERLRPGWAPLGVSPNSDLEWINPGSGGSAGVVQLTAWTEAFFAQLLCEYPEEQRPSMKAAAVLDIVIDFDTDGSPRFVTHALKDFSWMLSVLYRKGRHPVATLARHILDGLVEYYKDCKSQTS